jgi:hypothetical protein
MTMTAKRIVHTLYRILRSSHCKHLTQRVLLVREALHVAEPGVRNVGEVWTLCAHCDQFLRRRPETPDDAATFGLDCEGTDTEAHHAE